MKLNETKGEETMSSVCGTLQKPAQYQPWLERIAVNISMEIAIDNSTRSAQITILRKAAFFTREIVKG